MNASEPAAHALEIAPHGRAGARGAGSIQTDAGAAEDVRRHADALLADALVISVKTVGIPASRFAAQARRPTRGPSGRDRAPRRA
jgi:hypothetical protein